MGVRKRIHQGRKHGRDAAAVSFDALFRSIHQVETQQHDEGYEESSSHLTGNENEPNSLWGDKIESKLEDRV